jgi:hypothetical protein
MKTLNIFWLLALMMIPLAVRAADDAQPGPRNAGTAVVYKSPTCGCCSKWEKHLEDNGFKVESHPTKDMMSIKSKYHIPTEDRSCHTALIGGYVVEGHVPAEDIKALIKKHPAGVVGISVPGMPVGTPGMESDDGHVDSYDVVTFDSKGKTTVFSHHQ